MSNRLAQAQSPYLRQHADNPVHWYPWGSEAFLAAVSADKPILLSVGYSACHWCHVMAHESFEKPETAALMNQHFICIKVDRQEHPDVDQLYQQALQLFDESGGWPLTMFLLPSGEPFFGGTYFPPEERYSRPSFSRVLVDVAQAYRQHAAQVRKQAESLCLALRSLQKHPAETTPHLPKDFLPSLAARLADLFDPRHGGLGHAPKFPNPTAVSLLLRAFRQTGQLDLQTPVLLTLTKMARGGIYDHVGGGFARYSTDEKWLVPHFEKMLCDNALLIRLYAEAAAVLTEQNQGPMAHTFTRVIEETVGWLQRQMRAENGGFCVSLDADSEGLEGKYYVFTLQEIEHLLGPKRAPLFARAYDVQPGGNWHDPHGHGGVGSSILHLVHPPQNDAEAQELSQNLKTLGQARNLRVPPLLDGQVLTGPNALVVTGLATAGQLLGRPDWIALADETAPLLLNRLSDQHGCFQSDDQRPANLDDLAFLIEALICLSQATRNVAYLQLAHTLADTAVRCFFEPEQQTFYAGKETADGVPLVVRPVSLYDSAVPSGFSVLCHSLLLLAAVFPDSRTRYQAIAESCLSQVAARALRNPVGLAGALHALDLMVCEPSIVLVIEPSRQKLSPLADAARRTYLPGGLVFVLYADEPVAPLLAQLAEQKTLQNNQPTAYLCKGPVCGTPIFSAEELRARLSHISTSPRHPT